MILLFSRRGFALMTVMWVIVVLSAIVLSFAVMARTETYATMAFKESRERKFLAEAGVQRAIMELLYRKATKNQKDVTMDEDFLRVDGTPYVRELGAGRYAYSVVDETGKISINTLTDASGIVLNNLLRNLGSTEEEANIIVDSILDWKDEDNITRLNGAEDDYYMSLPNPYHARNANLETLEELLLVRGMTHDILYGNDTRKGLINFITIYAGDTTLINMNAAPRDVLFAIPGMTVPVAEAIIAQRTSGGTIGEQDGMAIVGENYSEISHYASFAQESSTYTIEASGLKGQEKLGYSLKATVLLNDSGQFQYLYYKSPSVKGQ